MNIYQVEKIITVVPGTVILNANQVKRRRHILVELKKAKLDDFKLDDKALDALKTEDKLDLSVCQLIEKTQFKAGEVIGYAGEVNKKLAQNLTPIEEVEAADDEDEPEIDTALLDAIDSLDPKNTAHFSANSGKPDLKVLSKLVGRKITGKERDQAWAKHQAASSNG